LAAFTGLHDFNVGSGGLSDLVNLLAALADDGTDETVGDVDLLRLASRLMGGVRVAAACSRGASCQRGACMVVAMVRMMAVWHRARSAWVWSVCTTTITAAACPTWADRPRRRRASPHVVVAQLPAVPGMAKMPPATTTPVPSPGPVTRVGWHPLLVVDQDHADVVHGNVHGIGHPRNG
jgi:hypothetical protein